VQKHCFVARYPDFFPLVLLTEVMKVGMQGWWNDTAGENRCSQEKNYSIVTLTTTDLTWTGLKSNCHVHGG